MPAIENKGEGIFLEFNKAEIQDWVNRPQVQARAIELKKGFDTWKQEHSAATRLFPCCPT